MISTSDASVFREALHRICQDSPTVNVEKTESRLAISSISMDELCYASVIFQKSFFEEWDDRNAGPFEVEAMTLCDLSNMIQKKSAVRIDMRKKNICFEITDQTFKRITLTDVKEAPKTLRPMQEAVTGSKLTTKSAGFLRTIKELASLFDETQLSVRRGTSNILFSGKKTGLSMEMRPQEISDLLVKTDICIEFPVKFLQHFSPLLSNFQELFLSFAPRKPLRIEGANDKWRVVLVVSKVEKTPEQSVSFGSNHRKEVA